MSRDLPYIKELKHFTQCNITFHSLDIKGLFKTDVDQIGYSIYDFFFDKNIKICESDDF